MYLFNRNMRLAMGHLRDGIEWAVTITEKVNQVTSLNVGVWTPVMSPGLGTLSFGSVVEHLTDLEDAEAKLVADSIYVDLTEQGATKLQGSVDDEVAQFIVGGTEPINPTHVAVVRSTISNGAFQRGVEVGIQIAQRATEVGGLPTAFLLSTTGQYAGVGWITAASSLRELEQAEQAVNADSEFVAMLDRDAATCYESGITTQAIWRRIV